MNGQNQDLLASSLQTAFNLSVLPSLVSSLVADLTEAVQQRIKASFDMASLAREMNGKGVFINSLCLVFLSSPTIDCPHRIFGTFATLRFVQKQSEDGADKCYSTTMDASNME